MNNTPEMMTVATVRRFLRAMNDFQEKSIALPSEATEEEYLKDHREQLSGILLGLGLDSQGRTNKG